MVFKVLFVFEYQTDRQAGKYSAKEMLIICKQVLLGFCHYLAVVSLENMGPCCCRLTA